MEPADWYDDLRYGFFFTEKVDRLPWVPVTEAELFAVCISSKVLELYQRDAVSEAAGAGVRQDDAQPG